LSSLDEEQQRRVEELETELVALNIKTRHLLTVVGQLTAYTAFQRGVPEQHRDEMDTVLGELNEGLKAQRERLPEQAFMRVMENGL
jgi:hypothetical protein